MKVSAHSGISYTLGWYVRADYTNVASDEWCTVLNDLQLTGLMDTVEVTTLCPLVWSFSITALRA